MNIKLYAIKQAATSSLDLDVYACPAGITIELRDASLFATKAEAEAEIAKVIGDGPAMWEAVEVVCHATAHKEA